MKTPKMKTIATVALLLLGSLLMSNVVVGMSNPDPASAPLQVAGGTVVLFGAQMWMKYGKKPVLNIPGLRTAGIDQEIWADRIIEPLFADDGILSKVQRIDDAYIMGGSVVHIPQAGATVNVEKNRSVFPGLVVRRTDTDATYPLDVYTSDPFLVTNAEQMQISYKKMDSILRAAKAKIKNDFTRDSIFAWSGGGSLQVLRTTGSLVTNNLPHATATGSRRMLTFNDFVLAQQRMDEQDIPSEERYALLDPVSYGELLRDPDVKSQGIEKLADRAKGIVAELAGFRIMKRSRVCLYDNTGTPVKKAPTAANATTDNRSSLFWQRDSLNCALGDVKVYETLGSAEHYGDIMSVELKGGSRQDRADGFGVISIVQAAA